MADMPQELRQALQSLLEDCNEGRLQRDAQTISERYRTRTGRGERLLTQRNEAAAYAAARMPATCAAACAALEQALACSGLNPKTLLDCGAGTGAAVWAANSLLELNEVTCLEREPAMREVGAELMEYGDTLRKGKWKSFDLTAEEIEERAELVIEGYMLGELPEEMRIPAARKLFAAAEQMLLLIEPGTPQGYANLRRVRDVLTEEGAYVAAPCPSGTRCCPMPEGDWCHFAVRVPRSRLHRVLKGGEAPYEDEKYAYLALMKAPPKNACTSRVLRHPQIAPGKIGLTLCEDGAVVRRNYTKKDPLWKRVRKCEAGDAL